jgi:hypothetical protein
MKDKRDMMESMRKRFKTQIVDIKESLEKEFRALLGVDLK